MKGDAVEGVLAELAEGEGGGAVNAALFTHHVAHQRRHGAEPPELVAVVAPAAAVGDGGRQVFPKSVVLLSGQTAVRR